MFPPLNGTLDRQFIDKLRVIGGVLLTQSRSKIGPCTKIPKSLKPLFKTGCLFTNDELNNVVKVPFGVDPTFISTESLYRATNVGPPSDHWRSLYDEEEMKTVTDR